MDRVPRVMVMKLKLSAIYKLKRCPRFFVALPLLFIFSCSMAGVRLKDLVAAKQYEDAAHHYAEHKDIFNAKHNDYVEQLRAVTDHLNEYHDSSLRSTYEKLAVQNWPTAQSEWLMIRQTLEEGRQALTAYNKYEILTDPRFRSPRAGSLEKALADVTNKIKSTDRESFANFNHFGDRSFFNIYPVEIDAKSFIAETLPSFQPKLQTARPKDLEQFLKLYPKGTILNDSAFTEISNQYVKASMGDQSLEKSSVLRSIVKALRTAKVNGFLPTTVPGITIAFVEPIRSPKDSSGEFPVAFDVDIPATLLQKSLEEILSNQENERFDFIIFTDFVSGNINHRGSKVETVKSEFVSGYRHDPNHAYTAAQARVTIETVNLATVRLRNSLDTCIGCGWAAALLKATANAIAEYAAQAKLNQAIEELRTIPAFIEVPLYQDYSFTKTLLDSKKLAVINIFVVDVREQRFAKHTFNAEEAKSFNIIYQLHEKDRNMDRQRYGTITEKELADWEKAPLSVSLSNVLDRDAESTHPKALLPAKELRIEVSLERERSTREANRDIVSSQPIVDRRFHNVVVVNNRQKNATGSGFFVRPDVVLTNYHVVQDATYVDMKMYGGEETFGKILQYDARLDLALIKVQARGPAIEFYNEPEIKLGSTVEAIGHPAGLDYSITRGVISAIRKQPSVRMPGTGEVLTVQTDTTLNKGNSGGPLFLGDKVVGIVSYGIRRDPTSEGLNFAIHYTEIIKFLKETIPDR